MRRRSSRAKPVAPSSVPLERFVDCFKSDRTEVQCAAALLAGELGLDAPAVRDALARILKEGKDEARGYALDALQKFGGDLPMTDVTPLLAAPGELGRRAQEIVASLGAASVPQLAAQVKPDSPVSFARSVIVTIGRQATLESASALLDLLPRVSPDLQRIAADEITRITAGLKPAEATKIHDGVLALVQKAESKRDARVLVAALHLLRRVRHPAPGATYLRFIGKPFPADVRAAALAGLSELADIPAREHINVFHKLLPILDEDDYDRFVRPALTVLGRLPPTRAMAPALEKLDRSKHRSVRAFALRHLGTLGSAKSRKTLLTALGADERKVFESAATALGTNPSYVPSLVTALNRAKTSEEAWRIAAVLGRHREGLPKPVLRGFVQKALQFAETRAGPFQAYFELLRSSAPELLREAFIDRGRKLMLQKEFPKAINILRHLDRQDLSTPESDLPLALAYLEMGDADVPRDRHPGLLILSRLARRDDFKLTPTLKPFRRVLDPETLLAAGIHFIDHLGVEKGFGAELLKFVRDNFPRSEFREKAVAKLKSERVR